MSSDPAPLDFAAFESRFRAALGGFEPAHADQLARHAWLVARRNEVMNLTRIVDPEGMAVRHVLDSLAALPLLSGAEGTAVTNVLDLGTGAGYPGLPIAIAQPDLRVTLLDSTRKKVEFLAETVEELGLVERVDCIWARFEDWIRPMRKSYDLVLARAVGPLSRLLDWTTNRWFGPLVLWKGPSFEDELREARPVMIKRRLEVRLDLPYLLPGDPAERRLIVIDQ